jgi:hypothetical protein
MTDAQQTLVIISIAVGMSSLIWIAFDIAFTWIMRKKRKHD